jgi:hypothetical protein
VRVDQDRRDAGASQHRRRSRTGEAAADDCNIRVPHAVPLDRRPYQCARKDKQILKAILETARAGCLFTEKQCRKNKIARRGAAA